MTEFALFVMLYGVIFYVIWKDRKHFRAMMEKFAGANKNNAELAGKQRALEISLERALAEMREKEKSMSDLQEHCAKLREQQRKIQKNHNWLKANHVRRIEISPIPVTVRKVGEQIRGMA